LTNVSEVANIALVDVSAFLKVRRTAAGITQAELGRRVHVTPSVISAYEHGTREPKAGVFVELLQALGVGSVPVAEIMAANRSRILVDVLLLAEALPYQARPLTMSPLSRSATALRAGTSTENGLAVKAGSL
jgi:transcriptional regulator with XRE-family HTH domain